MRPVTSKKQQFLGFLGGKILNMSSLKPQTDRLIVNEFSVNMKKIGVRLNENIRRFWRKKWILIQKKDELPPDTGAQ